MKMIARITSVCLAFFLAQAVYLGNGARAASQNLGGVTLLAVSPRIVTPNGDNLNDIIFFQFDTALSGLPIDSFVHDINGAKVSSMNLSADETALTWNGKNDAGQIVPAGIYIYSIKIGKSLATGTVVVAR